MKDYFVTFATVTVALFFALVMCTWVELVLGWNSMVALVAVPAWIAGSLVLAKRFGAAPVILVQVAALIVSWGALL